MKLLKRKELPSDQNFGTVAYSAISTKIEIVSIYIITEQLGAEESGPKAKISGIRWNRQE